MLETQERVLIQETLVYLAFGIANHDLRNLT
jgi:hypothetical protein